MTPFQQALLAIEIAVDALQESASESAREALEQIQHLGFDTRRSEERKSQPEQTCVAGTVKPTQKSLFPD